MFLQYYGLREQPFGVTPDPRFLYFGPSHREALASLYYGIETGRGFLALIAEPGMGKTTLLFHLLQKLRNSARTAFVFRTQCDSRDFLRSLMEDLGFSTQEDDLVRMQEQLNVFLVRESRKGGRFVLVVDEAQNLADPVLETVRMLSNFETPRAKLMQIVLAGQPQLAEKLADPNLLQLRQRISVLSRLKRLNAGETAAYIAHRLRVSGYSGAPLFSGRALAAIALESQGIPRSINNLCFHALTLGFAQEQRTIGAEMVEAALTDLELAPAVPVAEPREEISAGPSPQPDPSSLEEILAQLDASRLTATAPKAPTSQSGSRRSVSRIASHEYPPAPNPGVGSEQALSVPPASCPSDPAGEISLAPWPMTGEQPERGGLAHRSKAGVEWILWGPLIAWFAALGFIGLESRPNSRIDQPAAIQTASSSGGTVAALPSPVVAAVDRLQTAGRIGEAVWNRLTEKLRQEIRSLSLDPHLHSLAEIEPNRVSNHRAQASPRNSPRSGPRATFAKLEGSTSYEQEF